MRAIALADSSSAAPVAGRWPCQVLLQAVARVEFCCKPQPESKFASRTQGKLHCRIQLTLPCLASGEDESVLLMKHKAVQWHATSQLAVLPLAHSHLVQQLCYACLCQD